VSARRGSIRPRLLTRILAALLLLGLMSIDSNPIVRAIAVLKLSPSNIEKVFGFKSIFSGLTEGIYQALNFNLEASIRANIFAPVVVCYLGYCVLCWRFPKIDTKRKEVTFFTLVIVTSIVVNIVN